MQHDGCRGCAYIHEPVYGTHCITCIGARTDNYRRKTNGDYIRHLSDEEMAHEMTVRNIDIDLPTCQNKEECMDMLDTNGEIPQVYCEKCLLDWLMAEREK